MASHIHPYLIPVCWLLKEQLSVYRTEVGSLVLLWFWLNLITVLEHVIWLYARPECCEMSLTGSLPFFSLDACRPCNNTEILMAVCTSDFGKFWHFPIKKTDFNTKPSFPLKLSIAKIYMSQIGIKAENHGEKVKRRVTTTPHPTET